MDKIIFHSSSGKIIYEDDKDHFNNGVLRLINFNTQMFEAVLSFTDNFNGTILDKLSQSFNYLYSPIPLDNNLIVDPGPYGEAGHAWHHLNSEYSVVKSDDGRVAWLACNQDGRLVREINPPIYEEEYFEGDPKLAGGYGEYSKQADWRLEKAFRQVSQIKSITKLKTGNALDIGSGYGYFRKALNENGFNHTGIEVSKHAGQVAKSLYGYDTLIGNLNDFTETLSDKFNLITLWDVIEHVPDPVAFLSEASKCLVSNGFLVLKTPNINCPEANVLGKSFYSLKREHLIYFSYDYLKWCAAQTGFNVFYATSSSHFLKGFVGEKQTEEWANSLLGSDLTIFLQKTT